MMLRNTHGRPSSQVVRRLMKVLYSVSVEDDEIRLYLTPIFQDARYEFRRRLILPCPSAIVRDGGQHQCYGLINFRLPSSRRWWVSASYLSYYQGFFSWWLSIAMIKHIFAATVHAKLDCEKARREEATIKQQRGTDEGNKGHSEAHLKKTPRYHGDRGARTPQHVENLEFFKAKSSRTKHQKGTAEEETAGRRHVCGVCKALPRG